MYSCLKYMLHWGGGECRFSSIHPYPWHCVAVSSSASRLGRWYSLTGSWLGHTAVLVALENTKFGSPCRQSNRDPSALSLVTIPTDPFRLLETLPCLDYVTAMIHGKLVDRPRICLFILKRVAYSKYW